jgi:hypothetical protein
VVPDGQPDKIGERGQIRYLSEQENHDINSLGTSFFNHGWELWVKEVDAAAAGQLYRNGLGSPL